MILVLSYVIYYTKSGGLSGGPQREWGPPQGRAWRSQAPLWSTQPRVAKSTFDRGAPVGASLFGCFTPSQTARGFVSLGLFLESMQTELHSLHPTVSGGRVEV